MHRQLVKAVGIFLVFIWGNLAYDQSIVVGPDGMFENSSISVRFWARGLVARIDAAYSDESFGIQMMVSQPFQF